MMTSPLQPVCARTPGYKCNSADRSDDSSYEEEDYDGSPSSPSAAVATVPKPTAYSRRGHHGRSARTRRTSPSPGVTVAMAKAVPRPNSSSSMEDETTEQSSSAAEVTAEHPMTLVENEGDELAVEAATQNPECGRCGAVLGIAAGIASRKCSASLFTPFPPESQELRPLLGYVLAYSLGNVVRANELLGTRHVRSVYDCTDCRVPSLSLTRYVERFINFTTAPREVFVTAIAYIDRFLATNPSGIELALCNVHRLFAASFVVAAKFASDFYNSNKYYARVAGVSLDELNALERAFLNDLGYSLNLTPEQYDAYNRPAEFLSHIAEIYGDLLVFLCSLVKTLRYNWLVKQSWTPPSISSSAPSSRFAQISDSSSLASSSSSSSSSSSPDQLEC